MPAAWRFMQNISSYLVPENIYCASCSMTEIGLHWRAKPRGYNAWTALEWQGQTTYWLLPQGEISPYSANCLSTKEDWIPYGIHPRQHCWLLLRHQSKGWTLPYAPHKESRDQTQLSAHSLTTPHFTCVFAWQISPESEIKKITQRQKKRLNSKIIKVWSLYQLQ